MVDTLSRAATPMAATLASLPRPGRAVLPKGACSSSSFDNQLRLAMQGAPRDAVRPGVGAHKDSPAHQQLSAKESAKIDKASREMESLLLYTLLKQMWATIPKDPYFDSGLSSQFFQEMYLEELAGRVSSVGDGIGIAQVVKRELSEQARRTVTPEEMRAPDKMAAGGAAQAAADLTRQASGPAQALLPPATPGSATGYTL